MLHSRYVLPALVAFALVAIQAHAGLIITPTFDSSITGQADAAGIEATINNAIQLFENTYSNPINVSIDFYAMGSGLGESQVGFVYNQNYQGFYNALVATNANPAAIAGLTANGGNAANNPVNGSAIVGVNSANMRAVGLAGAPLCNVTGPAGNLTCSGTPGGPNAIDGVIGLNTNITYPPNANNGSNYGLMATTEHELDEILGLGSALPNCDAGVVPACNSASAANPSPEDLFSYTANGVFSSLTQNCGNLTPAYFSYSGAVNLSNFNTACNGGDWEDWGTNATPQVQDAFASPGAQPAYGPNEVAALSAIGYQPTVATPEPGTWMLLLSSLAFIPLAGQRLGKRSAK